MREYAARLLVMDWIDVAFLAGVVGSPTRSIIAGFSFAPQPKDFMNYGVGQGPEYRRRCLRAGP